MALIVRCPRYEDDETLFLRSDGVDVIDNDFIISRDWSKDTLRIIVANGDTNVCSVETGSLIVQDEWMTLVFRYDASTNKVDMMKDGQVALQPEICADGTPNDRTAANSYIAKSHWTGDVTANLEMSGFFLMDGYMSDDDAIVAGRELERGEVESAQQSGIISHQNYSNLESCRWMIAAEGIDCAHAPISLKFKNFDTATTMYRDYAFSIKRTLNPSEEYAGLSDLRFYDSMGRRLVPDVASNPGGNNPIPAGKFVQKCLGRSAL